MNSLSIVYHYPSPFSNGSSSPMFNSVFKKKPIRVLISVSNNPVRYIWDPNLTIDTNVYNVVIDMIKLVVFKGTEHFQRPVFSHGVSQHLHKTTNLWKNWLNWSSKLQENGRKTPLLHKVCLKMHKKGFRPEVFQYLIENIAFSKKNSVTSEGAVSHNVLYYHHFPIACYQVCFLCQQLFSVY